jgi:hypothetical protein
MAGRLRHRNLYPLFHGLTLSPRVKQRCARDLQSRGVRLASQLERQVLPPLHHKDIATGLEAGLAKPFGHGHTKFRIELAGQFLEHRRTCCHFGCSIHLVINVGHACAYLTGQRFTQTAASSSGAEPECASRAQAARSGSTRRRRAPSAARGCRRRC